MTGAEPAEYPERLGRWPAVGFIAVVWLELVVHVEGGQPLGLFMIAYTFITVAGMAYLRPRDVARNGETFSVWFDSSADWRRSPRPANQRTARSDAGRSARPAVRPLVAR